MNQPQAPTAPSVASTRNYADEEEDTIRVKSLSDLTLPHPPKDAAQARGYVNQVLMSIGKLQKTHGHEVYAWAQECLSHDEDVLKADLRFPRTDREIAAMLIKTCKTEEFGILFQQMVETERSTTGGMSCGRVMLRMIFKHFQLERDRIGMLGERNLLQLKVPGKLVSDLEAFKQKYNYILQAIPVSDLPKEQTLFNHLIDELEKSPPMAYKVQKSREAPVGSHRRTTAWLWEKAQDGYLETSEVPGAPAPTGAALSKKEKAAQKAAEKAEKDRKEKEKKEKEKKKREKEAAKAACGLSCCCKSPTERRPQKPKRNGSTTPRGAEVVKASKMTPAEKAKTPCMFYAYSMCKAKQCAFLHSHSQKYQGPPPRVLAKDGAKGKAPAKVAASVAPLVSAQVSQASDGIPQVNALPLEVEQKIPWLWDTAAGRHIIGRQALSPTIRVCVSLCPSRWLWDTAAGRHIIGRQALSPTMKSCLRKSVSPVAFATGGVLSPGRSHLLLKVVKFLREKRCTF